MLITVNANQCTCDGKLCDWLTHPRRGAVCETVFAGRRAPLGWQTTEGDVVCPACVVIRMLRESGPSSPAANGR